MKHKPKRFVAVYEDIFDWGWFDDLYVLKLFVCMIILASHKNTSFNGIKIKRGSFITSVSKLSQKTHLSETSIKNSLKKLTKTGEISQEIIPNKYRIITITNYSKYQSVGSVETDNKANRKTNNKTDCKTDSETDCKTTFNKRDYIHNLSIKKDKKSASEPCALGERRSAACVTLRDVREFQIDNKLGDGDTASTFFHGFDDSGTAFPENWKSIYERYSNADPVNRSKFLTELKQGKYKERWGSADEGT